jgi:cysteine-rich repeat protein
MACAVPNASATCSAGRCGLGRCNEGFADCDGDPANGCETDIRVDARHCGACGNACPSRVNATPTCAAGTCGLACSAGFHDCGGVCVSNAAPATCGTRCTPCPAPANGTAICDGTACGVTCNTGYVPAAGQCVPARCNNRVLDPGEGCDDGNNADGDGCSASCQLEANTVNRACGGAPTVIPIRRGVQWYVGDTSSAGDDVSGCGSNGPDQVWRFDLTTAGTLVVTVQPNGWDAVVNSGLVTCSDPGACLDGAGNGRAETRSIYLLPGRFWLVVDGTGMRNSGTYTLRVELM